MPRVAIGLPMYGSEETISGAIESLLAQKYDDVAVVAVDDCSPDRTFELASAYAADGLTLRRNGERLGMIGNWNRVLELVRELHPDFELFAWASDNDLRDPGWLPAVVRALDENPSAVLACTRLAGSPALEVRGSDPLRRFSRVLEGVRAGSTIYGLQRRVHDRGIPRVLLADVLYLAHLSLYGEFVQVPEVLWRRGGGGTGGSRSRQRGVLFAHPAVWSFAPVVLQHSGWLVWTAAVAGGRPPAMGRGRGLQMGMLYVAIWMRKRMSSGWGLIGKKRKRAAKRVRHALRAIQHAPRRHGWVIRSPIVRVKDRR